MVSDSSWERLSAARQQGIPSFHGEILAEATDYRLDLSQFQVLAATTDNAAYNALVCSEFAPSIGRDAVSQLGGSSPDDNPSLRSEERRVGKECVRTCRSGWAP